MMELKILDEHKNVLLKRREITFEVNHSQTKSTPSRVELRNKLADMLKTKPELIYVKRVETKTGTMLATGKANAYESAEQAKRVEPKHIVARNTPASERKEEKAEAEAPATPAAPAAPQKKEA
jgi:small subunit ribosomal protein S24e